MQPQSTSRTKSKAQLSQSIKRQSAKVLSGHPDLELAKKASKVKAIKDDAREHLLHDGRSPFVKEAKSYGNKAVQWAKGNRLVSIPLSILAGVVSTAIVKAVLGPKDLKTK